jgi:hypothetical protein
MAFYDLSKTARAARVAAIQESMTLELEQGSDQQSYRFCGDTDTYIRKAAYLSAGRIWQARPDLQDRLLVLLHNFARAADPLVRQTAVNAAGEIGKHQFETVQCFFDRGLHDPHHTVRNAVIGSVKKMGEVNPAPVLAWAGIYLQHPDKEIRREICHGIELRGRRHPEDILPLLQQLEWDATARVQNTLVHVLGQIAYKKGCLEKVCTHLRHWENKDLVRKALEEIIDVHGRYRNFSFYTQEQARAFIVAEFPSDN